MKLWLTLATVAALPAFAQSPPPTCPAPEQTQVLHSLRDLPAEIRTAIVQKTPDIVDSNQPFDATDVVMHGAHFNRFAFAWHRHERWIVVTEHGGIAYYNPVYTMVIPAPSHAGSGPLTQYPASLINTVMSRPSNLCVDATRALADKLPPLPPAKPISVTK